MSELESSASPLWRTFVPGVIVLVLLGAAVFGEKGILCAIKANRQKEELQQQVHAIEAANQQLHKEIDALHSDPRYLEAISRKELGMVKEDELVYQFRNRNEPVVDDVTASAPDVSEKSP